MTPTGDGFSRASLIILAGVLALDAITKTLITTPEWALHGRAQGWQFTALACVIVFAVIAVCCPPLAVGANLLAAATLANLLDSLDGQVRNPIVHDFGSGNVAFNAADVALYAGAVALWASLVLLICRSVRALRQASA